MPNRYRICYNGIDGIIPQYFYKEFNMSVKIVKKEYKESGYRYYLEITLSECVDCEWEEAYQEALSKKPFTALSSSGAPTIDKVEFVGNVILTKDFPEFAMSDVREFLKDLEERIEMANMIYVSNAAYKKQLEEAERKKEQAEKDKLAELNRKLNS